jgi:hypothetical protein
MYAGSATAFRSYRIASGQLAILTMYIISDLSKDTPLHHIWLRGDLGFASDSYCCSVLIPTLWYVCNTGHNPIPRTILTQSQQLRTGLSQISKPAY